MFFWNAQQIRKLLFPQKKTKTSIVTGCYQYLHKGHVNILEKAAALGELTVLLNSDTGILQMKGYLGEDFETRKKNLLDTGLVKRVLKFDTDPTTMMSILRPDVWVLGSDHTVEEAMKTGGEFVKKIVIIPYTKGISSSQIHQRKIKNGKCSRDKTE